MSARRTVRSAGFAVLSATAICAACQLFVAQPVLGFGLGDVGKIGRIAKGGAKVVKAAAGISDSQEAEIGREVAANLLARYGYYDNEKQARYLNKVGSLLAKNCDRPNIKYHFGILDTDSINAFAAPGGYILVTRGAMALCRDEAMLAGVLAHEIDHVEKKHIVKAMNKNNLLSGMADIGGAALKDGSREILDSLSGQVVGMYFKGLDRGDETDADRGAVRISYRAGYDPSGYTEFLSALDAAGKDAKKSTALLFKTHPKPADRIKEAKAWADANLAEPGGARVAERFSTESK